MLHMSSTHQMQQIHPNDLTLICPYAGVLGVGVRCSLSETGSEQAKKTQPVNGNGQFSKKWFRTPPPNPYISEKPYSRAFQIYPTFPYLRDTQWTQMRQQWHRPSKTQKVGRFPNVPERYAALVVAIMHPTHTILMLQAIKQRQKFGQFDQTPLETFMWSTLHQN